MTSLLQLRFVFGFSRRPAPLGLAAALVLAACGSSEPPALEVAELSFAESELLGLSADRRLLLAELAAFGTVVGDSTLEALVEPRVETRETLRLWTLVRAQQLLDSAGVDDAVLEARYRTDPELELTVRHLLVFSDRAETETTRARARARAEAALARIRAGEDLASVAAEVSEEPGAEARQGLLTPGREGSWVDEFWQAALVLEPGEISSVTETQYGFHVLRLEARDTVPFVEARTRVALDVAERVGRLPDDLTEVPLGEGAGGSGAGAEGAGNAEAGAAGVASGRVAVAVTRLAEERGLAVSEAWLTATVRDEVDHAMQQAQLLGFMPGLSGERLKTAVLSAFSRPGQNVDLARAEVRALYGERLAEQFPELRALKPQTAVSGVSPESAVSGVPGLSGPEAAETPDVPGA